MAAAAPELLAALLPSEPGPIRCPTRPWPWTTRGMRCSSIMASSPTMRAGSERGGATCSRPPHALIGANSDAVGWAPWQPRQLHRQGELRRATVLSEAHAAALLRSCAATQGRPIPSSTRSSTPLGRERRRSPSTSPSPCRLRCPGHAHERVNGAVRHHIRVALPDYGCANLALRPSEAAAWLANGNLGARSKQGECPSRGVARGGSQAGLTDVHSGLGPVPADGRRQPVEATRGRPRSVARHLAMAAHTPGPQLECID